MTGVEAMLWQDLRLRRLAGAKFRRQAPIGPYVLDFVCLARRVAVEIDGPSHDFTGPSDLRREEWLTALGYRVLRFSADDVLHGRDRVVAAIEAAVSDPSAAALRRHLPVKRGGDS